MITLVGTSGWSYKGWNPDGLSFYVGNLGLNAIELNMSFYRYPTELAVSHWNALAPHLAWSIKVNRAITHFFRFSSKSFSYWDRFFALFAGLDSKIAFYLFQLPKSMTPKNRPSIEHFFLRSGLGPRFALECRHKDFFQEENIQWARALGLTLVSIDAPLLPRALLNTSGNIYLRLHGRDRWYSYDYSVALLKDISHKIKLAHPTYAYIFFNNDTMAKNAQKMTVLMAS